MLIKTLIAIVILSCAIFTPIKLFCANNAPTPNCCWSALDSFCGSTDDQYIEPNSQADMIAAVNSKKANNVPRPIHQKLNEFLEKDTDALRELYLKCQRPNFKRFYTPAKHVEEYLIQPIPLTRLDLLFVQYYSQAESADIITDKKYTAF